MRRHWQRVGAIYIFIITWLAFLAIHGFLEYATGEWWPSQDEVPWAWEWMRSTFENLQSEAWQVAASAAIIERYVSKKKRFRASEPEE